MANGKTEVKLNVIMSLFFWFSRFRCPDDGFWSISASFYYFLVVHKIEWVFDFC